MTDKFSLTGKNLTIACKLLKDVTTILEKKNVWYCLDGGTLLGIVRENRLLPWDKDLDICITEHECPTVRKLAWNFRAHGYWVRVRRIKRNLSPFKRGDVRVIRVRNRKRHLVAGPVKLDIFVKYPIGDVYSWIEGYTGKEIVKSVPGKYLKQVSQTEFDGKYYYIPYHLDDYLTYRYGDWHTPQEEWDHLKEDRAINREQISP